MALKRKLICTTFLSGIAMSASAVGAMAGPLVVDDGTRYSVSGSQTFTSVWIGQDNPSQKLDVLPGGNLTSDSVDMGLNVGAGSNTATVTGNGTWTNNSYFFIGDKSSGNTLSILDGGSVSSGSTWLGYDTGSNLNALVIDNSSLTNSGDFVVGDLGSNNSVTIRNGATATSLNSFVGGARPLSNGSGNSVTVSGDGSTWITTNVLYFGNAGGLNTLNVENRGQVVVGADMVVGALDGSDGNQVFITGDGTRLDITKRLYVGRNGDNNVLRVEDGADLTSTDARIGGSTNSTVATSGNSVVVTGSGSTWGMTGTLRIGDGLGRGSSGNSLTVSDGGEVTLSGPADKATYIGFAATDLNNSLTVTGVGSKYTTNGDILVGANFGQAGNSLLEVTQGGSVTSNGLVGVGGTSTLSVGAGSSLSAASLGLQGGSTLIVGISDDRPASIGVTGAATLGGTLEAVISAEGLRSSRYDVITAGSLSGNFADLVLTGYNENYTAALGTDATTAYILFNAELGAGQRLNNNQSNVAGALDDYFNSGGTFTTAIAGLYGLSGKQLTTALTQVSGEDGASGGVNAIERATTSFLNLMLGGGGQSGTPGVSRQAAASSVNTGVVPTADVPPAARGGWSLWGGVYGGTANLPGDGSVGSHDTSTSVGGIATGWDYDMTSDARIGVAIAGGRTNWDLDQNLGNGDSTFFQLGAYGTQHFGGSYLSLAGSYAWHSMSTDRKVNLDGTEKLNADFDASNLSGRIEAGHRFSVSEQLGLTPYAAFQAQGVYMPGYSEDGGSPDQSFALSYKSDTATALRSELGLGFDTALGLDPALAKLFGRVAWAHDWNSDPSVQTSFRSLDMSTFTVNGAQAPDDMALVTAGADLGLSDATRLAATFDGEFGDGYQSYAGSLKLSYSW